MSSQISKTFTIVTAECNIPVEVERRSTRDEYGYVNLMFYGITTVFMRTPWEEMTIDTVISDIELTTRRTDYISYANMREEVNKIKNRDLFEIQPDRSLEERRNIFALRYGAEARSLTDCFHFPLLKGQVSKRFPNGSIKIPGQKCSVDRILGFQ